MTAALQASAPRIVGRYVLYGEIASGGMATVHFGRLVGAAGFSRPVAIKRLHAQFARDPDFVKMFLDEARLAARIAHPNVVPTLDVVAEEDEVFLVMEYVRGATLGQLVRTIRKRGERVQPLIGVGVVSGALQGLHAAHEARNDRGNRLDLVHRDISPQNVLVGTDGVPRILDFGVAKASGRLQTTRDGQLKGKLAYMAPEQVRGDPITRRTDIYAAAVVLWEVLTGKRLFYAENEASVLARVLSAEVPAPSSIVSDLPRSFDRVVLRGLERDPNKRYATAREMAADLEGCLGIASPTEIGEWVETTAADELRERAMHIAEIERSASEAGEVAGMLETPSGRAVSVGATVTGKRPREMPSNVWGMSTKKEGPPQLPPSIRPDFSQVAPLARAEQGSRPSRKLLSIVVVSVSVVALLLGVAVYSQARSARAAATHASSVKVPALSAAPAPQVSAVSIDDLPVAPSEPTASTPAVATAPTASPARPAATRPPAAAPSPEPAPAPARRAPSADCNPPYTADAKGHIHFKPNCI